MTQAEVDNIIDTLIIDNNTMQVSPAKVRSVCKAINSRIQTGDASIVTATEPLYFDPFNNNFNISKANSETDGYLSKEDWNKFNNGVAVNSSAIRLKNKGYFNGVLNSGPGIETGDLCYGWISEGNFGETLQYMGDGDTQDINNYEILLATGTINLPL